jgi:hypothetical protein
MAIKKNKFGLTLKVLVLVLGFILCALGSVYLLINSEAFTLFTVNKIVAHMVDEDTTVTFDNLRGTIRDSIFFDKLSIKNDKNSERFILEEAQISLDFNYLLQKGVFSLVIVAKNAEIAQKFVKDFDLNTVPSFNPLSCLAYWQAETELGSLSLASLELICTSVEGTKIEVKDLQLKPTDNPREKAFTAALKVHWKDTPVGDLAWEGLLNQRAKKINSKLQLKLFGQSIKTELTASQNRNKSIECSGYLSEAEINVDALANWLVSYWQEELPITFGGRISFSGSWLYSSRVGFLGNLVGECRGLSAVALGFFYKLCEINNEWKYLNESISITDTGSKVFGAAAALNGKVESIFDKEGRKFDLAFDCINAEAVEIVDSLPWALRYAMRVPPIYGKLSLSAIATGKEPATTVRLTTKGLAVGDKEGMAQLKGSFSWLFSARQNSCEASFLVERMQGVPLLARRLELEPIWRRIAGEQRVLRYKLSGDPLGAMFLNGTFEERDAKGAEGLLATVTGAFEGGSRLIKLEGEGFDRSITEVGPYDFILLR